MFEPKEERRRPPPRQRALKKARIVFNHRRSAIDCMVRNLSPQTARWAWSSGEVIRFFGSVWKLATAKARELRWIV
jgi:hypothetical protein